MLPLHLVYINTIKLGHLKTFELFSEALSYKSDQGIKKDLILAKSLKEENEKQKQISQDIQLANSAVKNYDYNSGKLKDKVLLS